MTRTEEDLRTMLRAPVEPEVSARVLAGVTRAGVRAGSSAPRAGRIGLVTALAVVVVVGAVLAVVAVRPTARTGPVPAVAIPSAPVSGSSPPPAAPAALSLDATVTSFRPASGYRAGATMLFPGEETVDAVPTGGDTAAATVHVGTAAARARITSRPEVDLGDGIVATWVQPAAGAGVTALPDALAWTVGGLTVTVEPAVDGATDAIVEAVARAVRIGGPEPLRVPVSVSSWPAGWVLGGVVSTYTHRDGATGTAGRDVLVDIGIDGDATGTAVTIDSGGLAFAGSDDGAGEAVAIAGRTWFWDPASQTFTWSGPDRFVRVSTQNLGIGRDDLQSLVAGLTLATDFADESTWFDATAAFPH